MNSHQQTTGNGPGDPTSADYLLAKLYTHFQIGGGEDFHLDASTLDFSGMNQKDQKLTGMKPSETTTINLFHADINSNSLTFGHLNFTLMKDISLKRIMFMRMV